MPRVWLNVELDQDREIEIKLGNTISSNNPVADALALVERAAEDARRWVRSQGPILEDESN